ncbi:MAG: DUF4189 domain-containing protein [Ancalomicrobiaceae bacterium]|nr:DUF4189 domain-containing protein [Ancalomicrobiaceae bacterium]
MRRIIAIAAFAVLVTGAGTNAALADWAIAFGQTGSTAWAYGTAWNYTNAADARKKALDNCRQKGKNCKIVAEEAGQCGALAIGSTDNAWGWSKGETRRVAAQSALDTCNKYSGADCEVQDSFCDD